MLTNPWLVEEKKFPKHGTDREKLLFLLNYALLAPSGHNTQPWLFEVSDVGVSLFADRTRALAVIDPRDRALIMSCGAALFHLQTAIQHFYMEPLIEVFPNPENPDLLAHIGLGGFVDEDDEYTHNLFRAITSRRTNRLAFKSRPIPEADLERLRGVVTDETLRIDFLTKLEERSALADLIAQGDKVQGANKHFRRELASWIHPNRVKTKEGLPGYALGLKELESVVTPILVRTFDWGDGQAAKDRQLAEGSPALVVLSTKEDTPAQWLAMGRALAHFLLLATHFGISVSYLNQPLEVPELRNAVARQLGIMSYPQLILRMGYGPRPHPTPRRPVAEVLMYTRNEAAL